MTKSYLKTRSIPIFLLLFVLIISAVPSVYGQEVLLSFNEGFLGDLNTGGTGCINCNYTSALGITNVTFGQVNNTGQFTAQGNDITGFVRFFDSGGTEYQVQGNIQYRITQGSTLKAFGFVPTNTSTVTIQTTSGSFNIYGISQDSGTTPTSTFGFILEGQTVAITGGATSGGNAAKSGLLDALNAELNNQPQITIADITVNEGAGTVTVTVSISAAPTEESTVQYSTQDSTAQAGSDFTSVSGTLTFPSGSTASQTFTIPITDDTIIEEDEFIIALLSNPTGGVAVTDNEGTVTIVDNDTQQAGDLILTLTQRNCWRFLSSPFQNLTYDDIVGPLWTQGVASSDSPPPLTDATASNIYLWDKSTSGNSTAGWTTSGFDLADQVPAGEGFIMSIFEDDNSDGTITTAEEYPKNVTVTGTPHPFDATVSPATMNTNSDGWTLIGNPFNDAIDFGYLVANGLTTDLTNVAYVYNINGNSSDPANETNNNPGGWVSTDGSIGDLHDGKIAVFQGFFVQNISSPTNPGITFNNASRTTGATFYGKEKEKKDVVRLELEGENILNSAWLTFSEEGSDQKINGDAFELVPFKEEYGLLASRKNDMILDIGQFPRIEGSKIPVYIETTSPGTFTLTATDLRLKSGSNLIFRDEKKGLEIPLDDNFSYSFSIDQANKSASSIEALTCGTAGANMAKGFSPVRAKQSSFSDDRFSIYFSDTGNKQVELPTETGLYQNYPNPFNPTTQISYQLPRQSEVLLEVYDLTGKLISTLVNGTVSSGTHNVTFDASNLSSGVYLYRLQTANQVLSRKLTVIK